MSTMTEDYGRGLRDGRAGLKPECWIKKMDDYRSVMADGVPAVLDMDAETGATVLVSCVPDGVDFAGCYLDGYRHGWRQRTGRDLELTAARLRAPAPAATCEACGGDLPCENYRCHTSPAAAAYYERIGREEDAAARACGREEVAP